MESLPLGVVYVLGLVVALLQMQRLPRVAAAAGGGFAILLLVMLVRPLVTTVIIRTLQGDPQSITVTLMILGFFFSLLNAAGTGAVAYAVFVDRPEVSLAFPGQSAAAQPQWNQPPR